MKAKQTIPGRNLYRAFYLSMVVTVGFCLFQYQDTSAGKGQLVNAAISWISNSINTGEDNNFAKTDTNKPSIKNYGTESFNTEVVVSLYSHYNYNAGSALFEGGNDLTENSIAFETQATAMQGSDLLSGIPAEIVAAMPQSQVKELSNLVSNMSAAQVVSRAKEDKSFRQNIQNAAGSLISSDMYALAAN